MSPRLEEFSLPLKRPLATARGEITARRGFLVGVEWDDGTRGVGEATPLPGWTESFEECAAFLRGLDGGGDPGGRGDGLRDREGDLSDRGDDPKNREDDPGDRGGDTRDRGDDPMGGGTDRRERPRARPAARHGIGLADADRRARREGRPLASILAEASGGGPAASSVPANATVGDGPVGETVAAAEEAVGEGFDCLKVKVGVRDLDADLDRLRAVRDAVGDGVTLRADANGAWDRDAAERAVDALADLDLDYVEQPLPAADLAGHAALRGRGIDVALDESLARHRLADVLGADAADVVVLKPMAIGGPLETVRAARAAERRGVAPVVTTTIDAAVARAAAVHVAAAIPDAPPCGLATGGMLAEDLGADPVPVADGEVAVPAGPGTLGDAFDDLLWDG
ncbi:mandelate racemase/muconate lactonizing enzyme family protein [Halegenticoccus soli]|uniref:mandelate racemase/muconate lactonizing enzyme family protein n=1 Tax=Halegenticoccus soli TaxID=1985678 RepID=UPI000C6D5EFD|nr:enolase C-terminal domain-like protein [Halegenticoccus soli]